MQERVGNRYWGGDPNAAMARMGVTPEPALQSGGSWAQSAFWGRIEGGQDQTAAVEHHRLDLQFRSVQGTGRARRPCHRQCVWPPDCRPHRAIRTDDGLCRIRSSATAASASRARASARPRHGTATTAVYLDGQAQTMFYRGDLSSDLTGVGSLARGNEGPSAYAFSLEGGKRFRCRQRLLPDTAGAARLFQESTSRASPTASVRRSRSPMPTACSATSRLMLLSRRRPGTTAPASSALRPLRDRQSALRIPRQHQGRRRRHRLRQRQRPSVGQHRRRRQLQLGQRPLHRVRSKRPIAPACRTPPTATAYRGTAGFRVVWRARRLAAAASGSG